MKIKCDKTISCGAYHCVFNKEGTCAHKIVSIRCDGQCGLYQSKSGGVPTQNKTTKPYNCETSK